MSEYFPESKFLGGRVKVQLDLSNYAAKTDLKNATGVDTPSFAQKIEWDNLNSYVDKFDIDKSKTVPTILKNLKRKVDNLEIDKIVPVPVDLTKGFMWRSKKGCV